jgi:hypothetical protein
MDCAGLGECPAIPEFPESFRYDLFTSTNASGRKPKRFGRLAHNAQYQTEIRGISFRFSGTVMVDGYALWVSFELFTDGVLNIYSGTEWDFGTGAIDDLCVIYASLPHDIGCHLTNYGWIEWKYRAVFDALYRRALSFYGCPWYRQAWHWLAVRSNSKFNAYWRKP